MNISQSNEGIGLRMNDCNSNGNSFIIISSYLLKAMTSLFFFCSEIQMCMFRNSNFLLLVVIITGESKGKFFRQNITENHALVIIRQDRLPCTAMQVLMFS